MDSLVSGKDGGAGTILDWFSDDAVAIVVIADNQIVVAVA